MSSLLAYLSLHVAFFRSLCCYYQLATPACQVQRWRRLAFNTLMSTATVGNDSVWLLEAPPP